MVQFLFVLNKRRFLSNHYIIESDVIDKQMGSDRIKAKFISSNLPGLIKSNISMLLFSITWYLIFLRYDGYLLYIIKLDIATFVIGEANIFACWIIRMPRYSITKILVRIILFRVCVALPFHLPSMRLIWFHLLSSSTQTIQ